MQIYLLGFLEFLTIIGPIRTIIDHILNNWKGKNHCYKACILKLEIALWLCIRD